MAQAKRKQKLKVFRTPIGFHDAYVAAPNQKAALEAWGSDTNLFAQGSAEPVADPALMKVPLEHPGQVVKVLRGTKAEQLAALARQAPERSARSRSSRVSKAEVVPNKPKKQPPKPRRTKVDKAEKALDALEQRQAKQVAAVERQQQELERKLRDLKRKHERARDKAQERVESERSDYQDAMRRYEGG